MWQPPMSSNVQRNAPDAVAPDSPCPARRSRRSSGSLVLLLAGGLVLAGADTSEAQSHVLTVVPAGTGGGVVTSAPSGINCGADCSETYPAGTVATLTPAPTAGSAFTGWSGDVDCTNDAQWTATSALAWDQNDADANSLTYALYLDGALQGTLEDVSCDTSSLPASCAGNFPDGFSPAVGVYLMQLEADRSGDTSSLSQGLDTSVAGGSAAFPVRVTMDANLSCTATFDLDGSPPPALFTDDPLVPGVIVKAVHFTELQDRINGVRVACGLSTHSFSPVTVGSPVQATDILSMRTALGGSRDRVRAAGPVVHGSWSGAGDADQGRPRSGAARRDHRPRVVRGSSHRRPAGGAWWRRQRWPPRSWIAMAQSVTKRTAFPGICTLKSTSDCKLRARRPVTAPARSQ